MINGQLVEVPVGGDFDKIVALELYASFEPILVAGETFVYNIERKNTYELRGVVYSKR